MSILLSLLHVTETKSHPYVISCGNEFEVVFVDTLFLINLHEVHIVPLYEAATGVFPALPSEAATGVFPALPGVRSNKCLHVTYPVRIGDCLCP